MTPSKEQGNVIGNAAVYINGKGIKKALEFREHYPLLNPVSLSDKLFDSANMRIKFESAKEK